MAQQHYVGKKHKRNEARRSFVDKIEKPLPAKSDANGKLLRISQISFLGSLFIVYKTYWHIYIYIPFYSYWIGGW